MTLTLGLLITIPGVLIESGEILSAEKSGNLCSMNKNTFKELSLTGKALMQIKYNFEEFIIGRGMDDQWKLDQVLKVQLLKEKIAIIHGLAKEMLFKSLRYDPAFLLVFMAKNDEGCNFMIVPREVQQLILAKYFALQQREISQFTCSHVSESLTDRCTIF